MFMGLLKVSMSFPLCFHNFPEFSEGFPASLIDFHEIMKVLVSLI